MLTPFAAKSSYRCVALYLSFSAHSPYAFEALETTMDDEVLDFVAYETDRHISRADHSSDLVDQILNLNDEMLQAFGWRRLINFSACITKCIAQLVSLAPFLPIS